MQHGTGALSRSVEKYFSVKVYAGDLRWAFPDSPPGIKTSRRAERLHRALAGRISSEIFLEAICSDSDRSESSVSAHKFNISTSPAKLVSDLPMHLDKAKSMQNRRAV
jgi:hypothetical protein